MVVDSGTHSTIFQSKRQLGWLCPYTCQQILGRDFNFGSIILNIDHAYTYGISGLILMDSHKTPRCLYKHEYENNCTNPHNIVYSDLVFTRTTNYIYLRDKINYWIVLLAIHCHKSLYSPINNCTNRVVHRRFSHPMTPCAVVKICDLTCSIVWINVYFHLQNLSLS